MCFSPEASFAVGGALVPVGGYCLWAAWRKARRLLPLAVVPVLLAAQQISEGFVWLALGAGDTAGARPPALVFLFFAFAFWPFWFPFVAAVGETRPAHRRRLLVVAALTSGWFWVLFYPLLTDPAGRLTPIITHHSIRYATTLQVDEYVPRVVVRVAYLLSIAAPLLLGPRLVGPLPGLLMAGSAAVTAAVFEYAFASVWCFFAALLGLGLCSLFYRLPDRKPARAEDVRFG
ncbi:MAG: hypothetical protein JWO38_4126 [Gemmataceae bacterium]|nr:hypothetical protein [Gemmataceae bacterium]